jgi:hypothetical protein
VRLEGETLASGSALEKVYCKNINHESQLIQWQQSLPVLLATEEGWKLVLIEEFSKSLYKPRSILNWESSTPLMNL